MLRLAEPIQLLWDEFELINGDEVTWLKNISYKKIPFFAKRNKYFRIISETMSWNCPNPCNHLRTYTNIETFAQVWWIYKWIYRLLLFKIRSMLNLVIGSHLNGHLYHWSSLTNANTICLMTMIRLDSNSIQPLSSFVHIILWGPLFLFPAGVYLMAFLWVAFGAT